MKGNHISSEEMLTTPELYSTAVQLSELGLTEKAIQLCEQLVQQQDDPEGLLLLGTLYHRTGRYAEALQIFQRALAGDAHNPAIFFHLGNTYYALGQYARAIPCFRMAIQLQPGLAAAYINLGLTWVELDNRDEAASALKQAIQADPQNYAAHFYLGNMEYRSKNFSAALTYYQKAETLAPQSGDNNLTLQIANTYRELQQYSRAAACYENLLAREPANPVFLTRLGSTLAEWGKSDQALAYLQRSLAMDPDQPEAYFYLGNAWKDMGKPEAAIENYRHAIQLAPRFHQAYYNLAKVLTDSGNLEEAAGNFEKAAALHPELIDSWVNLAYVYQELGDVPRALHAVETGLQFAPEQVDLRWNRAMLRLLLGHYLQAWADYEYRWQKGNLQLPQFSQPRWQGEEIAGKTLLIHCEQGLGDTLQFVRYLPLVKSRVGKTILVCQPPLHRLLAGQNLADLVVRQGDELPEFDYYIPLLSLPGIFHTTVETIPSSPAYLTVNPAELARWEALVAGAPETLRVGIVWQGNPQHTRDRDRSCPLPVMAALTRCAGVQLFSLQKGAGEQELSGDPLRQSILNLGPHIGDFADTAGAIHGLDVVISVDTSVAHLAGALGKPVWILLPFAPDWRWLLKRTDSPWYPTARLFRQKTRGDWAEVITRVARELQTVQKNARAS